MASLANRQRREHVHTMDMLSAAMTSRLVVMMTPADKVAIEQRARALDLTTSELVRRAAQSYDETVTPDQEAMLETLADELEAAVVSMRHDLQEANRKLDTHFAEMAALRAAPRPVVELDAATLDALAGVFGGGAR